MIKRFGIMMLMVVIFLCGCGDEGNKYYGKPVSGFVVESNCRHRVMFTASVAISHGYEYYIVRGMSYGDEPHAQTKAKIEGVWYWLFMENDNVIREVEYEGFEYCDDDTCLYDIYDYLQLVEDWTDLRDD